MSLPFSIYLDLVRIFAAACVFLTHAAKPIFGGTYLNPLFEFSGAAGVVIFFVLSGYVIAWAADTKETDATTFLVNRLARLWSVVIPSIILSMLLFAIGTRINPAFYQAADTPLDREWLRAIASGLFLNQVWFADLDSVGNSPIWSLSYEFWYYIFFAACRFTIGVRRFFLAIISVLIMGPKIAALLPIWLMGAWLYHHQFRLPKTLSWPLLFAPIIAWPTLYLSLDAFLYVMSLHSGWRLGRSGGLLYWYPFALTIVANIVAFRSLEDTLSSLMIKLSKPIRTAASFTLSTYLYHFPLFLFVGAVLALTTELDLKANIIMIGISTIVVVALGSLTEHRKTECRDAIKCSLEGLARQLARLRDVQMR